MIIKSYKVKTIVYYSLYYSIPIIILTLLFAAKKIDLSNLLNSNITDFQFNIITINSIFAGFLFTGLSIIIGVSDKESLKFLFRANRMSKIYKNIYLGIISNLLSMLLCILVITNISFLIIDIMVLLELILIVIGVLSLIVSIYHIRKLIKYISEENKK
ncbi:hypothetical protein Q5O14_16440 [Eubacteriaceae bacterium ES2]|nr:hypothetical protein Q5O14_16440 [Eubacteriaceae bacterium ES2]